MLCGVSVVFNSLDDVLGLMSCKCSSENGQVLVGFSRCGQRGNPIGFAGEQRAADLPQDASVFDAERTVAGFDFARWRGS